MEKPLLSLLLAFVGYSLQHIGLAGQKAALALAASDRARGVALWRASTTTMTVAILLILRGGPAADVEAGGEPRRGYYRSAIGLKPKRPARTPSAAAARRRSGGPRRGTSRYSTTPTGMPTARSTK